MGHLFGDLLGPIPDIQDLPMKLSQSVKRFMSIFKLLGLFLPTNQPKQYLNLRNTVHTFLLKNLKGVIDPF